MELYLAAAGTPKVKTFVWQACSDILPTRTNLCRKKIPLDPAYAICQQHDEMVAHALWGCPMARNVWVLVEGKLQKWSLSAEDFYSLVQELTPMLTKNEMEVWAIVSWAIWNARNRYIFLQKINPPQRHSPRGINSATRLLKALPMNGICTPVVVVVLFICTVSLVCLTAFYMYTHAKPIF